ncbi:MAG TPA: hypothetical protein VKD24_02750 [Candidatus Angelobacter sp.]|nr:hypothetical protein [Candidatus Angelobacter sp.]
MSNRNPLSEEDKQLADRLIDIKNAMLMTALSRSSDHADLAAAVVLLMADVMCAKSDTVLEAVDRFRRITGWAELVIHERFGDVRYPETKK